MQISNEKYFRNNHFPCFLSDYETQKLHFGVALTLWSSELGFMCLESGEDEELGQVAS